MTARRSSDVAEVLSVLADGGVVLMPTDTLPGLHARLDRPEAIARIATLKGREAAKPMLVLAASEAQAVAAVTVQAAEREDIEHCWPGPFTLVLPARAEVPSDATAGGGTLGVRVPGSDALRAFLDRCGSPLVSTSANVAGRPPATDLESALSVFGRRVDLVADLPWDGGDRASTVVDLTRRPPRVLRLGAGEARAGWVAA